MITINKSIQSEILMTTMEEIVPEDSLFRKIDKYIDFTFIYDEVKNLYCENNGRPSIDPVVLFKLVFIQALDGIKSMRKTCEKIKVDAEYRWFLGIPFGQDTPHFSTFSKNYERRFKNSDVFENICLKIGKKIRGLQKQPSFYSLFFLFIGYKANTAFSRSDARFFSAASFSSRNFSSICFFL